MNVEHILARKGREVRTIAPNASLEDALQRLRAKRIGYGLDRHGEGVLDHGRGDVTVSRKVPGGCSRLAAAVSPSALAATK